MKKKIKKQRTLVQIASDLKKLETEIACNRPDVIELCVSQGIDAATAEKIDDLVSEKWWEAFRIYEKHTDPMAKTVYELQNKLKKFESKIDRILNKRAEKIRGKVWDVSINLDDVLKELSTF